MKIRESLLLLAGLAATIALFFYPVFTKHMVPFPGDILASDFQPFRSSSYDGYAAGGVPNKAQYPDVIRQIYPWKTLVVESLRQGKLPLWNPYNFSGAPLLANFQSAALYPLNIFYFFLNQIDAWTILVIAQPVLAFLFTYLYTRRIGLHPLASGMSALSVSYGGFMSVWLEYNSIGHVTVWLPFILLSIEHVKEKRDVRWLAGASLASAAALLAGHPQIAVYTLLFCAVYAAFRLDAKSRNVFAAYGVLGAGIAALQLVPGMELIFSAARSDHDYAHLVQKILIQPWQLLALPFPNIFGNPATRTYWPTDTFIGKVTTIGLVPLFFLPSTLRRRDTLAKFFIWASALLLVAMTNNPLTALLYRIPLPFISASSPTLMSFLFVFTLSIAAGMGLDFWLTDTHSMKKLIRRSVQVTGMFLAAYVLLRLPFWGDFSTHSQTAIKALFYACIISGATLVLFYAAIKNKNHIHVAVALLLVLHTADLFVFFHRFNPFVHRSLVFPQHPVLSLMQNVSPERFWGYGTASIAANFASQYHIFSPEGYDPLYPRWYGSYLYSYKDGTPITAFDNATRSDASIASSFGDGGLSDKNKQRVLNALSVRYVLDRIENASDERIFPSDTYRRIATVDEWIVYENTHARPRAFMANGVANIEEYKPEYVRIRTSSDTESVLTLTDTYYPGWVATLDGNPTAIRKTPESMREVAVPAGEHTIVMAYTPTSVTVGKFITIVSILLLLFVTGMIQKKKL